jgi:hypothetical protein
MSKNPWSGLIALRLIKATLAQNASKIIIPNSIEKETQHASGFSGELIFGYNVCQVG